MQEDTLECLLRKAGENSPSAMNDLCDAVYQELRQIAGRQMAGERRQVTLQPTILVHYVWKQLQPSLGPEGITKRGHFFAAAAEAMRRLLVDEARRRMRLKRGGRDEAIPLEEVPTVAAETNERLLLVHDALRELEMVDQRKAEIVRMHFFGGLTHQEIAEALGMGESSVRREWTLARALLYRTIQEA